MFLHIVLLVCALLKNASCQSSLEVLERITNLENENKKLKTKVGILEDNMVGSELKINALTKEVRELKENLNATKIEFKNKLDKFNQDKETIQYDLITLDTEFKDHKQLSRLLRVVESCGELRNHGLNDSKVSRTLKRYEQKKNYTFAKIYLFIFRNTIWISMV